jgi:hypothetical protein
MKTQFKVGMKVDDGIGVGVVHSFNHKGYPIVTFIHEEDGSEYNWHFDCWYTQYLKEYKEEENETN